MLRAIPWLGLMACYSPSPSAGKPCGENGSCPEQLKCSPATNTCEDPSFVPPDLDASTDGPVDSQFCFGTGLVTSCQPAAPGAPFDVGTNLTLTLDTSDAENCDLVIDELCVLLGSTVTITGVVRAQGSRPLVIVAASAITIDGLVDVASRRGQTLPGAGGNANDCPTGIDAVTHTGGWGGSFGGKGGDGNLGNVPATGGTAPALPPAPTTLRGGCKGGDGAGGSTSIGVRGDGGGAIYLIAGTSLTIGAAGVVNASGGAGAGCQPDCGGGGGGSGGMIGLDAPTITVAGEVFANGGGGGEGSQSAPARAGNESTAANTPGAGGIGGSAGGDGGAGSAGSNLDGVSPASPTATNAGGGGGGGGAGVIKKHGDLASQGAISPPPT